MKYQSGYLGISLKNWDLKTEKEGARDPLAGQRKGGCLGYRYSKKQKLDSSQSKSASTSKPTQPISGTAETLQDKGPQRGRNRWGSLWALWLAGLLGEFQTSERTLSQKQWMASKE